MNSEINKSPDRTYSDNDFTFGQLTVESGLLDITCSGLLGSSSENTPKKNDLDETLDEEVGEICSCIIEGCTNIDNHHHSHNQNDEKNDNNTTSSSQDINKTTTTTTTLPSSSVPALIPAAVKRNLFNDIESQSNTTNVNDERLPNTNNKTNSTISSSYHPHHSFGDSTHFYSIAGGNLHGLSDDDDDEEEGEEHQKEKDELPVVVEDNESASSINSTEVVEINTNGRNVSFKANGNLEKSHSNEYLNEDGDIDESQVHVGAIVVECNSLKRDKMIVNLLEALEKTVNEKEELIDQVNELQERLVNQQQQQSEEEDVQNKRRDLCSPLVGTTETYSSHSDHPSSNSEVEDLKLQIQNLEKRLEADRKYLEAQTLERELERDDFQKTISSLSSKIGETKKEKERLEILISNQKTELEDSEIRMKETTDYQNELLCRHDKFEDDLKSAADKIFELRDIIRSLEEQVDGSTQAVAELQDENKALHEDVERFEAIQKELEKLRQENHEIEAAANTDITDELQAQVDDLAKRLERKLKELDNCPWSTRPNSSCSSNAVSVSNEDISVSRDLDYINKDKDCTTKDVETLFADGLRKLDTQFESLVRFEEIIMKKLQDTELRLVHSRKSQEDFESEKLLLQEKINSQITIISDFENRLDQFRFEPSPSAVTLSGLRARVTTLTGTVEELKGQLHLKQIEMQDLQDRFAGKEALLEKLSMQIPESQPPVKKYSISVQTEEALPIPPIQKHSDTQTDKNNVECKPPKPILIDASVQTQFSKAVGYPLIEEEEQALDLSSIQGPAPPTHSTPNYDILSVKGRTLRHKSATKFSDDFDLGRSPEVLREPVMNRYNNTVLSERLPNLNNPKEGENYTKDTSEYPGEKLPREIDTYLNNNNQQHDMSVVKEEQGGDSAQLGSESTITSAQVKDKEGKGDHVQVNSIACQTPPLSLANLIEAINDEDKYDQLSEAKNSGQLLAQIIENKDQEIRSLQIQLEDLQTCVHKYEELQMAVVKVQLCNAETNTDDKDISDRNLSTQDSIEESDEANISVVNWELLQNKNQGRKIEADVKFEVEVLKTQIHMLKKALDLERQKNSELQSHTIQEGETLNQAKGIKNYVSQERDRTLHMSIMMEKQRDEITKLQKRLLEMEQFRDLSLSVSGYTKTPNKNVATTMTNSFITTQNMNNCNNMNESRMVGDNLNLMNQRQAQKWQELYMRTKSYRKALSWQKKYLSIVITGYKDLLGISGALFEHPDYLQKQVPITPSSVGLCDHCRGKTKFRIYVRVVIATIRIRYMVSRWSDKQKKNPLANKVIPRIVPCSSSSQYASSGSSDSDNGENIRKGIKFSSASPPTKDPLTKKLKRNRSIPKRDLVLPVHEETLDTRLSEFLERFETIEKGIEREFGPISRKGKSEKIQLNK